VHISFFYLFFLVASKYRRNCSERLQARQDVPLARAVQTGEELQLQTDHMHRIEQMKAMWVCFLTYIDLVRLVILFGICFMREMLSVLMPSVLQHCRLGGRKGIQPVKKLSDEVLMS